MCDPGPGGGGGGGGLLLVTKKQQFMEVEVHTDIVAGLQLTGTGF